MSIAAAADHYPEARRIAERAGLLLRQGTNGLELAVPGGPAVRAAGELLARPRPGAGDPLWRATLAGRAHIVDATAGLGADAFHLAGKGASLTLLERSPVLVALLADAIERAASGALGEAARQAVERVRLLHGDARELLTEGELLADVVYLDPMFPGDGGNAAPPKGMAVLRRLFTQEAAREVAREMVQGATDEAAQEVAQGGTEEPDWEAALLLAARRKAARRVVVKRARNAPPLAAERPSGAIVGRTVRYDLYAPL